MKALKEIDWRGGVVVYDDFAIDVDIPILDQIGLLKEDLIQVQYNESILIDIGWYPEFSTYGSFIVNVVENADWENPLEQCKAKSYRALVNCIRACVAIVAERVR